MPRPTASSTRRSMAEPVGPGVDIGHVHLKVAELGSVRVFYCDAHPPPQPAPNTRHPEAASPPAPGTTALFHFAIRYPTRRALAITLQALIEAGVLLGGASDHGVSEALYLSDPDGNGIELYWDRSRQDWPRSASGEGEGFEMGTRPLDLPGLLAELDR